MIDVSDVSIGVLVQVRADSARLPLKYKRTISNVTSLKLLMHRLDVQMGVTKRLGIITPDVDAYHIKNTIDNSVFRYPHAPGVYGVRDIKLPDGSNDVRERYRKAAKHFCLDFVVRVCGDRPLVDGGVVDATIEQHLNDPDVVAGNTGIVTYSHDYEFVRGFGCEVFHRKFLDAPATIEGRKHVTKDVYTDMYKGNARPLKSMQWLRKRHDSFDWDLDTHKDLVFLDSVLRKSSQKIDPY